MSFRSFDVERSSCRTVDPKAHVFFFSIIPQESAGSIAKNPSPLFNEGLLGPNGQSIRKNPSYHGRFSKRSFPVEGRRRNKKTLRGTLRYEVPKGESAKRGAWCTDGSCSCGTGPRIGQKALGRELLILEKGRPILYPGIFRRDARKSWHRETARIGNFRWATSDVRRNFRGFDSCLCRTLSPDVG